MRQERTSTGFLLGFLLNEPQVGRVAHNLSVRSSQETGKRVTFERKVPSLRAVIPVLRVFDNVIQFLTAFRGVITFLRQRNR